MFSSDGGRQKINAAVTLEESSTSKGRKTKKKEKHLMMMIALPTLKI